VLHVVNRNDARIARRRKTLAPGREGNRPHRLRQT
jgi:hypothetical protein